MSVFIIGDVHGCLNTYLSLLDHWDPKTETLVQVGDLVDRGNFSPSVLQLAVELKKNFKKEVHYIKGNHEQMMIKYLIGKDKQKNWLFNGGQLTLHQFDMLNIDPGNYLNWLMDLPMVWENDAIKVSHAGLSGIGNPEDPNNPDGYLWNRKPLIKISKLQVIGHTPRWNGKPEFNPDSNSWNIDTGAYGGICLTGIKLKNDGTFLETISVPTDERDIGKIK
ncbi:serine/threonine protein phosphatase 1 [Aquiflexum balticum DSM 16537]|uniref:Serine/threonine protein phosphatase 1 n=1 Tax=Aquiflexum balticum DSM 16537 TaxID=758820 RepID=A0A1W2HAP6_9BACT|nr:metallophosphoesterase [Aquiflexum balticum]SMD45943.1 serine/threonine protein phosphatase 1 [Aquiflexum balticum DSM 16537]